MATPEDPISPHAKRRLAFADDVSKTVGPLITLSIATNASAVEFSKMVLSNLILANTGGLAALITLQQVLKDTDQIWLQKTWLGGLAFVAGLVFAVVSAAAAYFNYMVVTGRLLGQAEKERVELYQQHFSHLKDFGADFLRAQGEYIQRQRRLQTITQWASVGTAVAAGLAAAAGAFSILYHLS